MAAVTIKNIDRKLINSVKAIMLYNNPENKINNTMIVTAALEFYKNMRGVINGRNAK